MIKDILTDDMLKKGRFWSHPWGIVRGCTPISPGCVHCWLAGIEKRFSAGMSGFLNDEGAFNGHVEVRPERLDIPLHKRKPQVFAVWSDFFHGSINNTFRDTAYNFMKDRPEHYFLLITKRPAVAVKWQQPPLKNVIIIVTMENQKTEYIRSLYADRLARMGWRVGILVEPMLELMTINSLLMGNLSWIICGPESGPGKRPFNPEWALSLRDQAKDAGIPFYYKKGALDGNYYLELPSL